MAKNTPKNQSPPVQQLSFEQAVEQLEQIIERIESGEVPLEQSIQQYVQGTKLIERCRGILSRAESQIKQLSDQLAGDQPPGTTAEPGDASSQTDEPADDHTESF
jgi:exodeoxyribonuclease VII small subunit